MNDANYVEEFRKLTEVKLIRGTQVLLRRTAELSALGKIPLQDAFEQTITNLVNAGPLTEREYTALIMAGKAFKPLKTYDGVFPQEPDWEFHDFVMTPDLPNPN